MSQQNARAAGGVAAAAGAVAAIPPSFNLEPFDKNRSKWLRWVKRLESAFQIFGVPDANKKNMLLFYMGAETYNVLCDHMSPTEPETKTYAEIVSTLESYFDPEPLEMVELWKFRSRQQKEGESITDFITALQRESKHCKFEAYLPKALRNQLVFGLRSQKIKSRLIEEKNLTFDKAKQIAISMEASGEGVEMLNRRIHDVNLSDIKKPQHQSSYGPSGSKVTNKNTNKCFRCGSETHLANTCAHKNTICGFCKKKGHLQRVCLAFTNEAKSKGKFHVKKYQAHLVEEDNSSDTEVDNDQEVCVFEIGKINDEDYALFPKIFLRVKVGGGVIKFEVDSGSPVSLMGFTDKNKYIPDVPLHETKVELRSYCGNPIEVYGIVYATVKYEGQSHKLRLFVVKTDRHPLMGREWMNALDLNWNVIMGKSITTVNSSVNSVSPDTSSQGVVRTLKEKFPLVFESSVGRIEKIEASLALRPNFNPVFLKARTVPFSIRTTVEKEIERMVENGILVKVNHSEWGTPVVPVMKSPNKVRLCGDYKLTVNKGLLVDEHPLPTIDELFANMAGGEKFSKIDLSQAYLQMPVRSEDQAMLTLNTHLGLFRPTRLMYGVASAPAIFQREISQILQSFGVSG